MRRSIAGSVSARTGVLELLKRCWKEYGILKDVRRCLGWAQRKEGHTTRTASKSRNASHSGSLRLYFVSSWLRGCARNTSRAYKRSGYALSFELQTRTGRNTLRRRIMRYTESHRVSTSRRSARLGTSTGSSDGPKVFLMFPSMIS
jgi:hypothetical protein